jgi:hypothetical protein
MDEVTQQCGVRLGVPWLLHEQGRDGSIGRSGERISRSLSTPILNYKVATSADGLLLQGFPIRIAKRRVIHNRATGTHARTHHIISVIALVRACVRAI